MSTKRFPYVVRLFFVFALVLLSASPPVFAMPLGQSSGDMDIDGYCRYLGYNGSRLDPIQQNVFGWGCLKSDGTQAGMDLYDLCRWQYGGELPYPEYSEYADPYSWFCSPEDLSSPAQRTTGSNALSTIAGLCPGYDYNEAPGPWDGVNGTQYYFYANGVLRKDPSVTSSVVSQLPAEDGLGWIMDGPLCSANTSHCGNKDRIVWYKLNVDGVEGWYTDCDPVFGYIQSESTNNQTITVPTAKPPEQFNPPDTNAEVWASIIADKTSLNLWTCWLPWTHAYIQFAISGPFRYEGLRLRSVDSVGDSIASNSLLLSESEKGSDPHIINMGVRCRDLWFLISHQEVIENPDNWILEYRTQ